MTTGITTEISQNTTLKETETADAPPAGERKEHATETEPRLSEASSFPVPPPVIAPDDRPIMVPSLDD